MKIYIDIFDPNSNNNSKTKSSGRNTSNNMIRKHVNKGSKFGNYLKINLLIITIPIISYCSLYTWKYYKKTKKLIDDYLSSYLKKIKQKLTFFKEKLEAERIKNCNDNLNIDLDIYNFIDLNTCLEIVHLKTEITNRFLYLRNYELYTNKMQAIQGEVFEEYFCYFNEIKKKNKANDLEIIKIIEDNLNISYKKIEAKLDEEKDFLLEFNEIIMAKDFYTREKYESETRFSLYDFLNIDGLISLFGFLNFFKKQEKNKMLEDKSFHNSNPSFSNNTNVRGNENIQHEIFDPKELLNISVEPEKDKFTIPHKQIGLYCSAFLDYTNVVIKKLEEILNRNGIELIDQISVSRDLKNFTRCLLSNANDLVKEKYKLNTKNIFHVLMQNECFKDERITYYFEELKSYLIKFQICLLDS